MVASRMLSKILDSDSTSLAVNAREVHSLSSFDKPPNGTKALLSSWHNLAVKAAQVMEVPSVLRQGRQGMWLLSRP